MRKIFALAALTLLALPAWATTIFVTGLGPQDVQLIINNQHVRTLRIGETSPEGVKLVDILSGAALLEFGGRQLSLGIGQSTFAQTVLTADAQGHFWTNVMINGLAVRAIIDTGATDVSIGFADAQRLGIDYARGRQVVSQTAAGPSRAYLVVLGHVQVGDIAFSNVGGSVRTAAGPTLIGMSFLRHVDMRRSGNTMTLMRAH